MPITMSPHLIGKHPQHDNFFVSSVEHWQMQQQHMSGSSSFSSSSSG